MTSPILILHAEDDQIVPYDLGQKVVCGGVCVRELVSVFVCV